MCKLIVIMHTFHLQPLVRGLQVGPHMVGNAISCLVLHHSRFKDTREFTLALPPDSPSHLSGIKFWTAPQEWCALLNGSPYLVPTVLLYCGALHLHTLIGQIYSPNLAQQAVTFVKAGQRHCQSLSWLERECDVQQLPT